MTNIIEIAYKHIPFGVEFGYKGQMYTKTNFKRSYYWEDGRRKFRYFKKQTLVNTKSEVFDWVA